MGWEHFTGKPVLQGSEITGCWAACMSWWLAKVRKISWTMKDVANLYNKYASVPSSGCTIGGLSDLGVKTMFEDNRWSIWQTWKHRQDVTLRMVDSYLESSPTFISYYDPVLKGAHMNVIICRGTGDDPVLYVMDPDYPDYQMRRLRYYTEKSQTIVLASAIQWRD